MVASIPHCPSLTASSVKLVPDMAENKWDGAGAVPFCLKDDKVYFLLQETKGGKKEGFLVDFGGGRNYSVDTSLAFCGAREFTEETAGLFTADDPKSLAVELAVLDHHAIEASPLLQKEVEKCLKLVNQAAERGYLIVSDQKRSKWYGAYAIQLPYTDLTAQNLFFGDSSLRKVREYHWIAADIFLKLLKKETVDGFLPLHSRLFCLNYLDNVVQRIMTENEK